MSEAFIGEIKIFGFEWAPRSFATCGGQILSIAQNTALFSLLGTTFGGNGQTTFGLPDLRSRLPLHQGNSNSGTYYVLGESGGAESVTLIANQMPQHLHAPGAVTAAATDGVPTGNVWAATTTPSYGAAPNTPMNPSEIGSTGGNQPHANMPPYLVMNFCICLQGIFPSRN